MKSRASSWLTIRYHARAIFRACLAEWYGVLDWFAARWPLTQDLPTPPVGQIWPRVGVYPAAGPASQGQWFDVRVVLAMDKETGEELVPRSEGVDEYLHYVEKFLPPFALHRHT